MSSRVFSIEEVVSFRMDEDETKYYDPNEPLVEGSDEEFECLEEDKIESGR